MNRNTWIALLVCLNLLLLTGITLVSYSPPAAYAQAGGLSGNYLIVAGEVQDQHDALYIIDLRFRTLHAFLFDRGTKQLQYVNYRDLESDFRHNRG